MEGKNKIMMIIIIILLIVLIGAVVGLTLFSMQAMKPTAETEAEVDKPVVEKVVQLTQKDITVIPLSSLITTNLRAGTDGIEHTIRVGVSVGVNNTDKDSAAFITEISAKETVIRAIVVEILNSKTMQELKRPDGADILKNDILVRLQEEFDTNLIVVIYLSDSLYT